MLTPREIKADYRDALYRRGETVTIRRYTGVGPKRPWFDTEVKARVVGFAPQDFVGSIVQGDRKVIVLVEDLIDAQIKLPVTTQDKVFVRGKELAIISADDSTRRDGGVAIAYDLQVRG